MLIEESVSSETPSKVTFIDIIDIESKTADQVIEPAKKRCPGRPAKHRGSDSCATPTTVSCIFPLNITSTTNTEIIELVKKRTRGRPKKLGGKFVNGYMHDIYN